jgi:molybdopterin-guanine dinucleotide biosynthesis protein
MISDSRFIIIAGTAQNVGKTTLACQLIKHHSKQRNVIALKFLTLKDNGLKHKHHSDVETYAIIEEKNHNSDKDTSKMLISGASKSFLIISKENYIQESINEFMKMLNSDDCIIVESASLRNYVKPKLFAIVDRDGAVNKKTYIRDFVHLADFIIDDVLNPEQTNVLLSFK